MNDTFVNLHHDIELLKTSTRKFISAIRHMPNDKVRLYDDLDICLVQMYLDDLVLRFQDIKESLLLAQTIHSGNNGDLVLKWSGITEEKSSILE